MGASHGKVTNWYLTGRQNVSFRTSSQTGVGISIEFPAAHRHPFVGAVIDRPRKCNEFQNKFTLNGTFSPKEIRIGHIPLPGAQ